MRVLSLAVLASCILGCSIYAQGTPAPEWNSKRAREVVKLGKAWWKARPKTRFLSWDQQKRDELVDLAKAMGRLPEGVRVKVIAALWKNRRLGALKIGNGKGEFKTPFGPAWFLQKGGGKKGLVLGLHGGGEGAGSASEPAGTWTGKGLRGMYPQGIQLVHDTWNTVHGERFILTLLETAKLRHDVDPDRIYSMGFSMGGTGSWFMAGRHPDWLAGAAPCAGVHMASPKSQLASKEEVFEVQHGIVPNVRNLAMDYYIGTADTNCMPGTYLFVADMLEELRKEDPGGYSKIKFKVYPGLAHSFPPGEPVAGIKRLTKFKRETFPKTIVWENAEDPFPQTPSNAPLPRLIKHYFYWLHHEAPSDRQHIRATLDNNVISLEISGARNGASGLTIFLNETMIDVKRPVQVKLGKKLLYEGQPKPDIWTVLETMDARADRRMVFDRRIVLSE